MSSNNIYEMQIHALLYAFQKRMSNLVKQDAKLHQMDAEPSWVISIIEDEILPAVSQIVDWEPSDEELVANNACGTPWHDGCR